MLEQASKAEPHSHESHQGPFNTTSACFLSYYFCNSVITTNPKPCNCQLTFRKCKCFSQNKKGWSLQPSVNFLAFFRYKMTQLEKSSEMSQRRKSLSFRKGCSLYIRGHCNGTCARLLPLPRICWHPSRAAHYKLACIQMCLISDLSWFIHFNVKHINILFMSKMLSY